MNAENRCPQDALLRRMLDAGLSDQEEQELAEHLRTCSSCRQRLDELSSQDSLVSDESRRILAQEDQPEQNLVRMVGNLRAEGPPATEETAELNPDTANNPTRSAGSEISLDFLTASAHPQSLGRFGNCEITGVVGSGGMGIVLKALDTSLNRIVAIKVLRPEFAANATARGRFQAEAKAAAAITHDHVVTIHAVGEENGLPYLVMEYIVGVSLEERIKRTGPLKLAEILRIGMQAASGLAAAHSQGLVHRDVKPSNILLENGVERVKIVDFGLAKATDDLRMTQSGVVAGTPEYMSPEQTRARNVDHRSDLFSLGAVLYAMSTGRSPFRASTIIDAIHRVCDHTPRPIREINPDLPEWLVDIVNQLLAKDPSDRFQSSAQVAELLGDYLAHVQQPAQFAQPKRLPSKSGERQPGSPVRRLWPAGAAVVVLGVALLVIGWQVFGPRTEPNHVAGVPEYPPAVQTGIPAGPEPATRTPVENGVLLLSIQKPEGLIGMQLTIRSNGYGKTFAAAAVHPVELAPGKYEIEVRNKQTNELNRTGTVYVRPGERRRIQVSHTTWNRPPLLRCHEPTQEFVCSNGSMFRFHAISPNGKVLVLVEESKRIQFGSFSKSQWHPEGTLTGHSGRVLCMQFSPDGKVLAASGDGGDITLWSLDSTQVIAKLKMPKTVFTLSFSPDGTLLAAAGYDSEAVVWELATGKPRLRVSMGKPGGIVFGPDGKILASGHPDGSVAFWSVSDGVLLRRITAHSNAISFLGFSPDGKKLISASFDSTAKTWDVSTGQRLHTLGYHRAFVYGARFSPDGKTIASACGDHAVRFWDAATGQMLEEFHAHWGRVTHSTFSDNGTALVTSGDDGVTRIWNVTDILRHAQKVVPEALVGAPEIAIDAVRLADKVSVGFSISPDGSSLAIGDTAGDFQLVSLLDLRPIYSRTVHRDSFITSIGFLPDGNSVLTAGRDEIKLWDTSSGTLQKSIPHGRSWAAVGISAHQDLLAINHGDEALRLQNWKSNDVIQTLQDSRKILGWPVFSPDGALLAALTRNNQVAIWNTRDFEQLMDSPVSEISRVSAIAFAPNGKLFATGDLGGTVHLWEVGTWRKLHTLPGITGQVRSLSFSRDGRMLAAGGGKGNENEGAEVDPWRWDGRVALWNPKTGRQLTQFRAHLGATWQVGFSVDGTRLITLGDPKTLRVWDIRGVLEDQPDAQEAKPSSDAAGPEAPAAEEAEG